jgi:hypothetical protein
LNLIKCPPTEHQGDGATCPPIHVFRGSKPIPHLGGNACESRTPDAEPLASNGGCSYRYRGSIRTQGIPAPVNIHQKESIQSPRGKWESKGPKTGRIYLELRAPEEAAHAGTFHRVTENDEGTTHEAGTWALKSNELRLMIFAYEGPGNIALGTVQAFKFATQGPDGMALADEYETDIFQRVGGFES